MMRRVFVGIVLLILGVLLYVLAGKEPTPTKKILSSQEATSTSQKTKKPTTPTQRVAPQNIQGATGADFEDDPVGTLQLDGQVLDEEGNGLAGALVGVSSSPSRQTVSGKDGFFSFDKLVGRTYYLEAHKGELQGSASLLLNEDATPVTIRMIKGSSAEITVLDEVDRSPIPNAEVSWGWMTQISVSTDAEGKALVQGLDRWAWLHVNADGYSPKETDVQLSSIAGSITKKTVLLAKGALVSGVVQDPDGKPIANARIDGERDSMWGLFGDDFHKILSDEQGRWSIPALSAGTYRFSAKSDEFSLGYSEPTTLDGKTPTENVIIRLEPGGIVTGKVVTQGGAPVVGAIVHAMKDTDSWSSISRRAYSDEEGKFTIKGMPKAPLRIGAKSVDGNLASPASVDLTNGPAEVTLTIDIAGTITGIVVDMNGKPIPEAEVNAFPVNFMSDQKKWNTLQPGSVVSDPDGRFEVKGVVTGEDFSMSASFPEMSFGNSWSDKDAQVLAKSGDRDVKLVLKSLGKVKGKVQFADGAVPKKFTVDISFDSRGDFTDAEGGNFELEKVSPGKQNASVNGPGFIWKQSKQFQVVSGETTDIGTITIEAGRTVQGKVLLDGKPVEKAVVIVSGYVGGTGTRLEGGDDDNTNGRALTKADGLFMITGIEKDEEATAIAEHPILGRSKPIKIEKNTGDATIELVLLPGGSLEGTMTRAGKPIQGYVQANDAEHTGANFHTSAGVDGKFRFDFLTPGTYEITASAEWTMVKVPGQKTITLTIEAGKTKKTNIDIPEGVTVTINPTRDGKILDRASITLFHQSAMPKNTEELEAVLKPMASDQVYNGYVYEMMPGSALKPVVFGDMPPGSYTLCLYKEFEDDVLDKMSDEEKKAPRPIFCQAQTIAATPSEQTITVELPAGY
jgi:protocatechuate 3,4-dioxygenase beta subunit